LLQVRPTFSESWYRVAALKPRLRAGAQISRQYYRGERWYVVRDPAGNQYHRLSDPAYRFVGLLDGSKTIEYCWDLVGGQLADDAPTQPEVIQILSQLYAANLLETDVPPDATILLRRHKDHVKKKMQGRLMNVLFPRIPIWDPDQFLKRWMPVAQLAFSWLGAAIWLVVVFYAVATLAPRWDNGPDSLTQGAKDAIDPSNWLYLWAVFVGIKAVHELGHAFSCRRFGGECHELGLMLLVFVPTPYVDASSAWAFPNRWKRVFVGAAGMIVELFVASLCSILWRNTGDATYPLVHQLAFNAMFIASVSTILFNANPLLRYDGYYILSDFLEIPNLRQKSTEYTLGLIKRHIFRLKQPNPLPPPGQRAWLLMYSLASGVYRLFVGVMIVVLVTFKVPVLGVLMAISGVVTWAGVPVYKLTKYLALEPELYRKRGRAIAFSAAMAVLLVLSVGVIPFNVYVKAEGVLEPNHYKVLYPEADGFVTQIYARDGQWLHAGDPILTARNDMLNAEIASYQAQYDEAEASARMALAQDDMTDFQKSRSDEESIGDVIRLDEHDRDRLTIRAPFDGKLIAPELDQMSGAFLVHGRTRLGMVATMDDMRIKGVLDSNDAELPWQITDLSAITDMSKVPNEIRLVSDVGNVLHATRVLAFPAAGETDEVNPILGPMGGGTLEMDPKDQKGTHPKFPQFKVELTLDNPGAHYIAGQRAHVRFTMAKRPLIWQWMRRFWQLIQTNDNGKWL
jgi:putative peptide zinc metalloprotease protein